MPSSRTIKLVVFNYGSSCKQKDIRYETHLKTWHEQENFVGLYRAVRKELRLSAGSKQALPEQVIETMIERGYCKNPLKIKETYCVT